VANQFVGPSTGASSIITHEMHMLLTLAGSQSCFLSRVLVALSQAKFGFGLGLIFL
jgi:hypothetical protein